MIKKDINRSDFLIVAIVDEFAEELHQFPNKSYIWIRKWDDFSDFNNKINGVMFLSLDRNSYSSSNVLTKFIAYTKVKANDVFEAERIGIAKIEKLLNVISVTHKIGLQIIPQNVFVFPFLYDAPINVYFSKDNIDRVIVGDQKWNIFSPFKSEIKHDSFCTRYEIYPEPQQRRLPDKIELTPEGTYEKIKFDRQVVLIKREDFFKDIEVSYKNYNSLSEEERNKLDVALTFYRNALSMGDLRTVFTMLWFSFELLVDKETGGLIDDDSLEKIKEILKDRYERELDRIMNQIKDVDKEGKRDRMAKKLKDVFPDIKEDELKEKLKKLITMRNKISHPKTRIEETELCTDLKELKEMTEKVIEYEINIEDHKK